MRMAGPREALWHALIRRNHGATHFMVGRDHAGPGNDATGTPFYGPYDAQDLLQRYSAELGVTMVPCRELLYLPDEERYEEVSRMPSGTRTAAISGTQVREQYLNTGQRLPSWFTRPEVAEILAETILPGTGRRVYLVHGAQRRWQVHDAEVLTVLLSNTDGTPCSMATWCARISPRA